MSRFGKLLIAALLFTGFSAFAQNSDQPASAPPSAKPNRMRGDRAEQKLKRLSKRLNLTDDQKEKLRPILQDEEQQLKSVEDDNVMTPQQKHRKAREIRMSFRSQMDAILTPEQKDKLQSERPRTGGRYHRRRLGAANSDPGDPL